MGVAVPLLEAGKGCYDIDLSLFAAIGEHAARYGCEARQHLAARRTVIAPTKLQPQRCICRSDGVLLVGGGCDDFINASHEIEPAPGKGPLAIQVLHSRGNLPPERLFGVGGLVSSAFQRFEKITGQRARLKFGGRERESNPPRTVSRPLPDLKSGRPTGDDSLPASALSGTACSAWRRNRSSRCLLMRRKSPLRSVTPCRSKNSRISIATLRPLLRRSRKAAAVNCPSLAKSIMISTISATVPRRKNRSCAISSSCPMRPSTLNNRLASGSGRCMKLAMSRTRGGLNRSSPPRCGWICSQVLASAGVSLASWPGRRTHEPSSATSCAR